MAPLRDLIAYCETRLEPAGYADFCVNGLQVPGSRAVVRLVTGVSATRALIERAVTLDAQLVLVHHGLIWNAVQSIDAPLAGRLAPLLAHDIALAAYHLPLDAHPEIGNNALLAEALGCEQHEAWGEWGRIARFGGTGIPARELFDRVESATGRIPLVFPAGPDPVRTLGVITGGAAKSLPDAIAAGLDAFLTGEPREPSMAEAQEGGVHFIAAGHYATETRGVRALGEELAERFGVDHRFVDLPNPV